MAHNNSQNHSLQTLLAVEVVPALIQKLSVLHSHTLDCEHLARLWSIRFVAIRCAAARGFALPPGIMPPDGLRDCAASLDALTMDWAALPARTIGECYEALIASDRSQRKARGSFYTPEPIVERIVAATLDPLTHEREERFRRGEIEWDDLFDITILDPAMGSGHFLLAAIDHLVAWLAHLAPDAGIATEQSALRRVVLERCIFGVDNDGITSEVARLCLWLHCASAAAHSDLPATNLRCGNSLFGQSFAAPDLLQRDNEELALFNWPRTFPKVAARGGFDAVVGNPPYLTRFSPEERRAALAWTRTRGRELDAFYLFVERSVGLLRPSGRCGMIIPNVFLRQHDSAPFRRFLLGYTIERIIDYRFAAFGAATVPTAVLIVRAAPAPIDHGVTISDTNDTHRSVQQSILAELPDAQFSAQLADAMPLLQQIAAISAPLATFATSHEGIHSGNIRHKLFTQEADTNAKPMLKGSDISRYDLRWGGWYVRYDPALIDRSQDEYASLRDERLFTEPKILTRQTGDRIIATWDDQGFYTDNTLHSTQVRPDCDLSPFYLLALLNSRLLSGIYQTLTGERGRALAQVKLVFLRRLPIRHIQFNMHEQKRKQIVKQILEDWPERVDHILHAIDGWLAEGCTGVIHDLLVVLAQQQLDHGDVCRDELIDHTVERLYGIQISDLVKN